MAQPIYFDPLGIRQAKAQGAAAPYLGAAYAVEGVTQSIEKYLFEAQRRKDQEKERKMALMGTLVSKYGFSTLGPDFAEDWEKTTGMKFSRDPETGRPVVPQTDEEKIRAMVMPRVKAAIEKDPRTALVYAGLAKAPPSPEEMEFKNRELASKERLNDIRAEGYRLRYAMALAKSKKDDIPSGFMLNPDSGKLEWVGFSKPSLSNKQLSTMDKVAKFNMSSLDAEAKQANIERIHNIINNSSNPLDKQFGQILKSYDKIKDPKAKALADAYLKTIADTHHLDIPEDALKTKQGWNKYWTTVGGAIAGGVGGTLLGGFPAGTAIGAGVGAVGGYAAGREETTATPSGKPGMTERLKKGEVSYTGPKTSENKPLSGMSDDQIRDLFRQKLQEGMHPIDIIDQSGNDIRAIQILSEITGEGQNPQLPAGWRPGMAPVPSAAQ